MLSLVTPRLLTKRITTRRAGTNFSARSEPQVHSIQPISRLSVGVRETTGRLCGISRGLRTSSSYNMLSHSTIINQVSERFDKAREAGDLLFFPSEVFHHEEAGIQFQIRLCPALQNKPRLPAPHFDGQQSADSVPEHGAHEVDKHPKKPDPFAPPYIRNLFVGGLLDEEDGEEFVILLNKYSVVPNHFLMVTKEYKSQTGPIYPTELIQTYLLLDAAKKAGKNFFAFYNCGDVSGASQPHKHIQFIPIDDDGPPVERLVRTVNLEHELKAFTINSLPFATHVRRLPASLSSSTPRPELEEALNEAFMNLLDLAISSVRYDPTQPAGQPSYNVILTCAHMYIVPRRKEEHILRETGDPLSVNALGFAGMLLVKSERELEAVKRESVVEILRDVAFENVHEEQLVGAHEMDP